jgi:hypothetical protein
MEAVAKAIPRAAQGRGIAPGAVQEEPTMSDNIKQLIRLSKLLQQTWLAGASRVRPDDYLLNRLDESQQDFERARRLLDKARRYKLELIVPQLHEQRSHRLKDVQDAALRLARQWEHRPAAVPGVSFLVAELEELQEEFGDLQLDWESKILSATTEPITLEEIGLGPFAIQLPWQRLASYRDSRCFDIVALDPNPAVLSDSVTHPHVKNLALWSRSRLFPQAQAVSKCCAHR